MAADPHEGQWVEKFLNLITNCAEVEGCKMAPFDLHDSDDLWHLLFPSTTLPNQRNEKISSVREKKVH